MATIRVHFLNPEKMLDVYFAKDVKSLALGLLVEGQYTTRIAGELNLSGEAAAEEIFDISNNPDRDEERQSMFGRCRSVSVGDIVEVDGDLLLCASVGWHSLS